MRAEQFHLHADVELRHWWFLARRQILRRLIRRVLPPDRGTTILDVGCGTGANLAALSAEYRCLGIDTSAEAIDLAKGRFPQVEFIQGMAPGDLGARICEANLVMMTDVLEHVGDDFALLGDLLAATEPGTYFLLTVPADESLWSQHDESFGHYRRYTAQRLHRLWVGLPVRTLMISHFNSRLYPLIRSIRTRNRRLGRSGGEAGTDFKLPPAPLGRLLERVFRGEGRVLEQLLAGKRAHGYRRGVSLVALIQRERGRIPSRRKPADVEPDLYDPQAGRMLVGAGG